MANNARSFVNPRQRELMFARGHTMPSDPKCLGSGGCHTLYAATLVFGEIGISVPISRGSPPILING